MNAHRNTPQNIITLQLICLGTGQAKVVKATPTITLSGIIKEWFHEFYNHSRGEWLLFDVNRMRFLTQSHDATPEQAGLADRDTVLLDFADGRLAEFNHNAVPMVESFEMALRKVEQLNPTSQVPQVFACELTDEEFGAILSRLAPEAAGRNKRFGGSKLLRDLIVSADFEYSVRLEAPVAQILFEMLQRSTCEVGDEFLGESIDRLRLRHSEIPTRDRKVRLVCNAAALHIEPSATPPNSLLALVRDGDLQVGELHIDSETHVVARPLVFEDSDLGRSEPVSEIEAKDSCRDEDHPRDCRSDEDEDDDDPRSEYRCR